MSHREQNVRNRLDDKAHAIAKALDCDVSVVLAIMADQAQSVAEILAAVRTVSDAASAPTPRVVIHQQDDGSISVLADPGPDVYWVDDRTPSDRIYQMSPDPIPDRMLEGHVGHGGDGSPAETRAHACVAAMEGRPHLSVVPSGSEDPSSTT